MTYSAAQLDQIVKLVVERLRQMPTTRVDEPRDLAKIYEVTEGKVDTSTMTLAEKVITTASLENRLEGISRVLVSAGSVVTPAARDLLRDRKIHLQFGGQPVRTAGCSLVIGSDQKNIAPDSVAGAITANCLPPNSCWKNLLGSIVSEIKSQQKLGVLITDQAATALCVANRNEQLRAIGATTPAAVLDDKRQLGANLLVVDPRGRGVHGVRQLVGAFARDGYLNPPRGLEL